MAARPRVAIVGGGMVGSALGRALRIAGYPITLVASRTRKSAEAAATFIADGGEPSPTTTHPERALALADLVLVATPDGALPEVAATLAAATELREGTLVAHCAGSVAADVLAPVAARGAMIGALHPLQAFASAEDAVRLIPGTVFGVEGDKDVQPRLVAVVEDLGGTALPIAPGSKPLYHAAAVIVSNYTAALAGAAVTLMHHAGAGRDTALAALLPLLEGTVQNLRTVGLPDALTGPIARGDVATVQSHLDALRDRAPDLVSLYASCGRLAVQIGQDKGTLDDAAADVLRAMLARLEE